MRAFGAIALALLLCGCAAHDEPTTDLQTVADRVAQAHGFAGKARAANEACAAEGREPGTEDHAGCMRTLLRAEGQRARSLADALADRAAKHSYTCIDKTHLRLVRCYDI